MTKTFVRKNGKTVSIVMKFFMGLNVVQLSCSNVVSFLRLSNKNVTCGVVTLLIISFIKKTMINFRIHCYF